MLEIFDRVISYLDQRSITQCFRANWLDGNGSQTGNTVDVASVCMNGAIWLAEIEGVISREENRELFVALANRCGSAIGVISRNDNDKWTFKQFRDALKAT